MRWNVLHLVILVFACAIAFTIYHVYWGPRYVNSDIAFGAYLASIVAAAIAAWDSMPRYRRLWVAYTVFGVSWIACVLRSYFGPNPDIYGENFLKMSTLGVLLGILSALAAQFAPGMKSRDERPTPSVTEDQPRV
jgi:hypothetical protein